MKIQLATRLLSAALLCMILAACSFDERIADHAVKYNKTVEEANNSLLLLNILRARDRRPMHFTAFSQLRGKLSQTSAASIGLNYPFGNDAKDLFTLSPTLSLSQTTSPSFDLAILDKQQFVRGILSPIEISVFKFYLDQRWPTEILLHLLVHKVTVSIGSWAESNDYKVGNTIRANGFILVASNDGKSGDSEPKWGETDETQDPIKTVDNKVTWLRYKTEGDPPFMNWKPSETYESGDLILENGLIWKSSAGKSDEKAPEWSFTPGETIEEKFVTWTAEKQDWAQDVNVTTWAKNHDYGRGKTIFANALVWQSSGGKSGGKKPDWPSNPGATVTDGEIIWMAEPALLNAPAPKKDIKFRIFQKWVERIRKKVSFGASSSGRPIGPPLDITGEKALKQLVKAEEAKLRLVKVSVEPPTKPPTTEPPTEPPTRYQLCKITSSTILCIGQCPKTDSEKKCRNAGKKKDDAEGAPSGNGSGQGDSDEDQGDSPTPPDAIAAKSEKQTFLFHLRSVQGIMYYLGELLRYQRGSEQTVFAKDKRVLFNLTDDRALAEEPFVSTTYEDKTYYLAKPPKEGMQSRAGLVLALVSQLLGLHKSSIELPTTTAVETVGGSP